MDEYTICEFANIVKETIYSNEILTKIFKNDNEKEIIDKIIIDMIIIISSNNTSLESFINDLKLQCNMIKMSYTNLIYCEECLNDSISKINISKSRKDLLKNSMNKIENIRENLYEEDIYEDMYKELVNYIKNTDILDKNILLSMIDK
jgi:hypothetical protein